MKGTLPTLRMGSYLAFQELPAEIRDGLVPVRVERIEPVVTFSYEPIPCETLMAEDWMLAEWPHLSVGFWEMLDGLGAEAIAEALNAISGRHGNKALCLLDHDSPSRGEHGDTTARVVFAAWWEEATGEPVPELLRDGSTLHYTELPKRVRPKRPKAWRQDHRWRDAPEVPWPPTEEAALRWIEAVHWQTARSPHNPHQYNVREWGPPLPFLRLVQWVRETGETERWGGDTYRYKRLGDFKLWSMGATLPSTVILNRKEWGADPQDREKGAEETDREPSEAPLFDSKGRPLTLADRINAEHRACALAAGSAVRHAVRCGGLLREAKAEAGYGNWLTWLRENFEGSPRTAQLYMKLHRDNATDGKYAIQVAHLEAGVPQETERRSA